jgi:hypothetical protein
MGGQGGEGNGGAAGHPGATGDNGTTGGTGVSGAAGQTGGTGASGPDDNQILSEEIFQRDLFEVHLLIDFVSSLPGKSLSDLRLPDPAWKPSQTNQTRAVLDSAEAVRRISLIRFPPEGTPADKAEQAALLLLAKDALNELARPARGRSIAYSTMFAAARCVPSLLKYAPARPKRRYFPASQTSRTDLAERATPDLIGPVRRFRCFFNSLLAVVFLWLVLTSLTYWDIALGGSILQHIDQLESGRSVLLQANPGLSSCPNTADKALCWQVIKIDNGLIRASDDLARYSHCRGVWKILFLRCWPSSNFVGRNVEAERPPTRQESVSGQAASEAPGTAAANANPQPVPTPTPGPSAPPNSAQEQTKRTTATTQPSATPVGAAPAAIPDGRSIASIISVFTSLVLPMMFGVLGTLVATIRAIHDKLRDNLLSTRDLVLTLTSLPIGAIAGLIVGLFFNPPGSLGGAPGLSAGLSLSAGGLAFLAGYAADAFFSFLDSIRSQVFNATNPPPGADAPPRPVPAATPPQAAPH